MSVLIIGAIGIMVVLIKFTIACTIAIISFCASILYTLFMGIVCVTGGIILVIKRDIDNKKANQSAIGILQNSINENKGKLAKGNMSVRQPAQAMLEDKNNGVISAPLYNQITQNYNSYANQKNVKRRQYIQEKYEKQKQEYITLLDAKKDKGLTREYKRYIRQRLKELDKEMKQTEIDINIYKYK